MKLSYIKNRKWDREYMITLYCVSEIEYLNNIDYITLFFILTLSLVSFGSCHCSVLHYLV